MITKKACPFCGTHKPKIVKDCCTFQMVCETCGAAGPSGKTLPWVMKQWDRRSKPKKTNSYKGLYATFQRMRDEEDAELGRSDGNNQGEEVD